MIQPVATAEIDDDGSVNPDPGAARILLIADDPASGKAYRGTLEAGGYQVRQAASFVDVLGSAMPDPDVIVLCGLAHVAYPGQQALVLRVPDVMTPDELVGEVRRRVALRTTLHATSV